MGTRFTVWVTESGQAKRPEMHISDLESVAYAAMLARPFTLRNEAIYGPDVSTSLLRFATNDEQRTMSAQLELLWTKLPGTRMHMFASRADGIPLLPVEGVTDAVVADRVLYSQLAHADDASDLLEHISTTEQQWSLEGYVGDLLATAAHQQAVLRLVRPDLCEELSPWAGSPNTVFERMGAEMRAPEDCGEVP